MVWPILISVADVPGPYFACADAALAIRPVVRPVVRPTSAAAPRLLQSCMSFPPVVFLVSFYGHPRFAHDRLVALAFGRDVVRELCRSTAHRNATLLRNHSTHLRRLDRTHRLLAHLLEQVGRHALGADHAVPRDGLITRHARL